MASVTESSLNLAAHEVVAEFNKGASLNDSVTKKAAELGLNDDQTCRLIERSNSEAFLSRFPDSTEFPVADPNVILSKNKVASVAPVEKVAHVKTSSYKEKLNRDPYEIFGIEPIQEEKVASDTRTAWETYKDRVQAAKLLEDMSVEKTAHLLDMETANNNLWNEFKNEALSGRSVASIEKELILSFPEKVASVCSTVSYLTDELAEKTMQPVESFSRLQIEDINPKEVVLPSKIAHCMGEVLKYAEA